MKYKVLISAAAKADFRQAKKWYERKRLGLGDEFFEDALKACHDLEILPMRHRVSYKRFRRFALSRFPYQVYYRIDGTTVIVGRVLHESRDLGGKL